MVTLPKGQGVFLPPFKAWLASNIPAVYDNTMTYYEELVALIKYLQDIVVPAINDNASAVTTISKAVEQLQSYVENYFANLDVQEEINNKLDEMAEDGTLQEIITEYIQANVAWTFDTVADMKTATNLVNGSYARTLGFHSVNDGGGALYKITNTGTANEMDVIAIGSLFANLTDGGNVKQFGAYGNNTHDDTDEIQEAINKNYGKTLRIDNGVYLVRKIIVSNNIKIVGNGKGSTIKSATNNDANTLIEIINNGLNNTIIRDLHIDGDKTNQTNAINGLTLVSDGTDTVRDRFTKLDSITIQNCSGNGLVVGTANTTYIREVYCNNIKVNGCEKSGYLLAPTDSSFTNCVSAGNIEDGFKVTGNDIRFTSCKAYYNGIGDQVTPDPERAPASAFQVTADETPLAGKSYYTRSGTGVNNDPYIFTKFNGNTFASGTTYYEMTTLYTVRYSGFDSTSKNSYVNCSAQENYGDGFYMRGSDQIIDGCRIDNNGILTVNGEMVSYTSQSKEQCYYGIYSRCWRLFVSATQFFNFRNTNYGKHQKAPLYVRAGELKASYQAVDQVTNDLLLQGITLANQRQLDVTINEKYWYATPTDSDITAMMRNDYYWYETVPVTITYRKGNVKINGCLQNDTSLANGTSGTTCFVLPSALRPKKALHQEIFLTNNHGYTLQTPISLTIETNGYASVRALSTAYDSFTQAIIDIEFEAV